MRRLAVLVAVLAVLVAGSASALSFGSIRNQMVQFLLDKVSVEGVFEITADEVESPEDEVTSIVGLKIADADGVWFTAERLNFAWNKSRLLRGEIEFDNLELVNVEVLRQPVIPPGEEIEVKIEEDAEAEPFAWPRSPLTTNIARVGLENVHLHEAVLGHEITFNAVGRAQDEGDIQAVSLDLRRTDATEGTIDFEYVRNFEENTLALDLIASEAAGGLVASLLDLPGTVPTALTLKTQGTPAEFNVAFDLDMPDYLDAEGTAVLDYAGPIKADAEFSARPGPLMPEDFARLLGEEAELVLKVEEGSDQTVEIQTARISSPDLRLSASGTYSRATGAADLEVELVAEPGLAEPFEGIEFDGLTFTGRIEGEPGSLTADGDLTLNGFSTEPAAVERAALEIDVRQTGTADAPTTELSVTGDVVGLRLDQIPPEVIGNAELEIVASLTGDELTLETAWLDSNVLQLSASGMANTATGDFDLGYGVAAPELAPVLAPYGVAVEGSIDASGQAVSTAGVLTVDTGAELTGFEHPLADAGRLRLEGRVVQEEARTTFNLAGTGEALRIDQIGPDLLERADLAASGRLEGDVLTLDSARLTSPVLDATAEGRVEIDGGGGSIGYRVAAGELGPVAARYGVELEGGIEASGRVELAQQGVTLTTDADLTEFRSAFADADILHLEGTVTQSAAEVSAAEVGVQAEGQGRERITFDLEGSGEALRIDRIGPDLLERAEFAAQGALEGQMLTLQSARLESPVLDAAFDGEIDLGDQSGRVAYDVDSVALAPLAAAYDLALGGTLAAEGVAHLPPAGSGEGPRVEGEASVDDLAYAAVPVGDLVLRHDVMLGAAPGGELDLRLTDGPYAPGRVQTRFRLDGQQLTLDDLDAAIFGLAARGDVVVDLETTTAEGTLDIDAADLGRLPGAPVTGRADGRLRLTAEGGRQNAELNLAARGLAAGDTAIGEARITGRVTDALGPARVDLDIAAESVVSGDLTLATLAATAKGPLSGLDIALRAAGELDDKALSLDAAARADLSGEPVRATVSRLDASIGADRIALVEPLRLTMRGAVVSLDNLALALPDGGSLAGNLTYFGGPIGGTIRLDMPDLSVLTRLFDAPIRSGALRLDATFDTRRGRARADATIAGRDIVFADIEGAGVLGLDATIDWDGRVADIDGRISGTFGDPMVFRAALPVRAGGTLPELASSGPVSARLQWQGEIGDLWALVPLPGHIVTGKTTVDIGVSGDISNPTFTGGVALAEGTYQNLDIGTILTGLSLATEIEEGGALGMRLDAVDGAEGSVRLDGRIGFGDQGVDLTVETREAVLVRRDDAIARLAVDLRIAGPMRALAITGKVTVVEAEIRLVNNNPPSIVTLGDVRIKGAPEPEEDDGAALPIRLEIDIVSPGRIFVRGRGLDSEWRIDLKVRGDADEPRITGEVAAVRGRLDLIGKTFDLERGRVLFDGGSEIDPRIDVVLERETSDLTGRIIVDGYASDPQLSFASTPGLPEDEVLPQILFGKSAQALSPSQGVQLALGLATLLDGGGGTLDQVRSAVGLDSLNIEQDEKGDAALAIGKQVDENIWVGTKQSLGEGGTSVAVEIDVFRNVTVEGEVGTDGDSSLGVQWRKDF